MAIKKCKECNKEVSSSAKTCPHCGVKKPGISARVSLKYFIVALVLSMSVAAIAMIPDIHLTKSIGKSDSSLSGKPATVFHLGGDKENYCTVTFTNDFFKSSKGKLSNLRRNQPEFDMDCNWDSNYYVISTDDDTFVKANFYGKEDQPMTLFVDIDAKLTTTNGESASVSGNDIAIELDSWKNFN